MSKNVHFVQRYQRVRKCGGKGKICMHEVRAAKSFGSLRFMMIGISFAYIMSNETHESILLLLSSALCCLPGVIAGHLRSTEKGMIDAFGWSGNGTRCTCLENCHHIPRQKIFLPLVRPFPPHKR